MKKHIESTSLVHAFVSSLAVALVLSVVGAGCTDDVLAPSQVEDASSEPSSPESGFSEHPVYPTFLTGSGLSEATGMAAEGHAKNAHNGFASPLFGLATAPNGDILVADAGAGVATRSGATDIPLPGVTDMSPLGRGSMWAATGAGADPTMDTGQALYRASKGKTGMIANLFAFEAANDPDGPLNPPDGNVDSNPFDVQSLGGRVALVADAGGNDLLRVDNQGTVEVLAVFPNELVSTSNFNELAGCPPEDPLCAVPAPELPAQAVPTSVAVGPDGYYYVGELKGFPAPTGESNIWKVAADASGGVCPNPDCEKVFEGGFTSIIDLAFSEDGTLYVAELDEASWAAVEIFGMVTGGTINACDLGTKTCSEVATGIPILTAITFGKDGTLWATKNALIPGLAEVIEVPLP